MTVRRRLRLRVAATPLAAALLAGAGREAGAQEILGRVVESPSGRPLGGVGVRLYRVAQPAPGAGDSAVTDSVPVRTAVTANDGAFALIAPGPGTYRVRVGVGALAPAVTLAADSSDQRVYAVPLDYAAPLYESQVDTPPAAVSGTVMLLYPESLKRANVTGCATVEAVIDAAGRAEAGSIHAIAATHAYFADAATNAVAGATYTPAVRDGRRVRALVVVPMQFAITGVPDPEGSSCQVAR